MKKILMLLLLLSSYKMFAMGRRPAANPRGFQPIPVPRVVQSQATRDALVKERDKLEAEIRFMEDNPPSKIKNRIRLEKAHKRLIELDRELEGR